MQPEKKQKNQAKHVVTSYKSLPIFSNARHTHRENLSAIWMFARKFLTYSYNQHVDSQITHAYTNTVYAITFPSFFVFGTTAPTGPGSPFFSRGF